MLDRPERSAGGGIQVVTTDRGLPIRLKLDQREFAKPPQDLARDILALCQLSAARTQVAQRREMRERGAPPDILRGFNLATEADLESAEAAVRGVPDDGAEGDDGRPATWMRSV